MILSRLFRIALAAALMVSSAVYAADSKAKQSFGGTGPMPWKYVEGSWYASPPFTDVVQISVLEVLPDGSSRVGIVLSNSHGVIGATNFTVSDTAQGLRGRIMGVDGEWKFWTVPYPETEGCKESSNLWVIIEPPSTRLGLKGSYQLRSNKLSAERPFPCGGKANLTLLRK